MTLHGFKKGQNLYKGDSIPKLNLSKNHTDKLEITNKVTEYLSERWEEHSVLVELGRFYMENDDLRLIRLKKNIEELNFIYGKIFKMDFITYKINSTVEGIFLFLDKSLFMFISPIICFYYDSKGHIQTIYFRTENSTTESDYFEQLNLSFELFNVTKKEQNLYNLVRHTLLKSFYTTEIDGNSKPLDTLDTIIRNFKELSPIEDTEKNESEIIEMFGDIKESVSKSKHNFITKYNMVKFKNLIIFYINVEPVMIISTNALYNVKANKVISNLKDKLICKNIEGFSSQYKVKNDELQVMNIIANLYKPKNKIFWWK